MTLFRIQILSLVIFITLQASAFASPALEFSNNGQWSVYKNGEGKHKVCVARTSLDNGFVTAFSGAKALPSRLSIDFKQNIFTAGKPYDVKISTHATAPRKIAAKAMSASVLAIYTDNQGDIISAISKENALTIDVQNNSFKFNLKNANSVIGNFKDCKEIKPKAVAKQEAPKAKAEKAEVIKSPAPKKTVETTKPIKVDFSKQNLAPPAKSNKKTPTSDNVLILKRDIEILTAKNIALERQLVGAKAELAAKKTAIESKGWNTEEATIKYQESERQIKRLGEQMSRERLSCQREKEDLEAQLFDPAVTEQKQLAKLSDLERQLEETKREAKRSSQRCDAKIMAMEKQLSK